MVPALSGMLFEMVVLRSTEFVQWLARLRDLKAQSIIVRRLNKIEVDGHFGETRSVGGTVSEIKVNYGPGYRLYFTQRGVACTLLLIAGDKSSQARDILKAQRMAAQLHDTEG